MAEITDGHAPGNDDPKPLDALSGRLGQSFWRIGAISFWTQLAIAVIPVIAITAVFSTIYNAQSPGPRIDLVGWMAMISFVILLFTTFWAWLHMRRGRRLEEGRERADLPKLGRAVWVGLGASSIGILLSIIVLTAEIVYLLVRFLEAPQAGVPVIQTVDGGTSWVSAVDILGLMTLVLTVAAEIIVLVLGLWLLFRVTTRGADPALQS
jgi:hypothetical protein